MNHYKNSGMKDSFNELSFSWSQIKQNEGYYKLVTQ